MMNIGQMENFSDIGGFKKLRLFREEGITATRHFLPESVPDSDVQMLSFGLVMMIYNFIGAAPYHARILNLNPEGREYRSWVRNTIFFIISPVLEMMLAANGKHQQI